MQGQVRGEGGGVVRVCIQFDVLVSLWLKLGHEEGGVNVVVGQQRIQVLLGIVALPSVT